MQNYRFPKACRLRKSKQIESLFKLGNRFYEYPYNVVWLENNSSNCNIKIAISIPKKLVAKASQRNRIKRLTREAVRKKSYVLKEVLIKKNKFINLFLIYNLNTILNYSEIENKISVTLQRLADEV